MVSRGSMTSPTDRLANALGAMGCSHPRAHAVLLLEVWDQIREDMVGEPAAVIGIGARLAQERGARYGSPAENWGRTAKVWEVILGHPVTAEQVGLCMVGVKLARLVETPDDEDSLRDLAGYAAAIQLLHDREPTV